MDKTPDYSISNIEEENKYIILQAKPPLGEKLSLERERSVGGTIAPFYVIRPLNGKPPLHRVVHLHPMR